MHAPIIEGGFGRRTTAEHLQAALCSWTRQAVMVALSGPRRTAGELAAALDLGRNLVSHHTRALEEIGLAQMEREGTHHYWHLTDAARITWEPAGLLIEVCARDGARLSQYLPYTSGELRLLAAAVKAAGHGIVIEPKPRQAASTPGTPDRAPSGSRPPTAPG